MPAHQPEGRACAQENAGDIGVDHIFPTIHGQFVHGNRGRIHTGVVEQQVQPAEAPFDVVEQGLYAFGVPNVCGHGQRLLARSLGRFGHGRQRLRPSASEYDMKSVLQEPERDTATDAGARACDERDPGRTL